MAGTDLYLAAWDTGRNTGYAIFETFNDCLLVDCGVCDPALQSIYEIFEQWPIGYAVAEKPQHYRRNQSKGDPNKLTPLAIECGDIRGIAFCAGKRADGSDGIDETEISLWYPMQWKGQLPKPVTQRDCKQILTYAELDVAGADTPHDKWDAIALGLYELDRLGFRKGWLR
jgi:hypothetical protein